MGDGPQKRIHDALRVAERWGHVEGGHHKQWVIDQMVQALTGYREYIDENHPGYDAEYQAWVAEYARTADDETGWDEGIAP